jgi:hypothetical protein
MSSFKKVYRDGLYSFSKGEVFEAPGGEIVEVLYKEEDDSTRFYFVELPGVVACSHGETIEEAIEDAREKRGEKQTLTEEQKAQYQAENYRFSVRLFRKLTKACRSGCVEWLNERGLDMNTTMTLKEFREAGGGQWADTLEEAIK